MNGNRRLAKRSIIGTKICALWKDGRFYPGVITDHTGDSGLVEEAKYTVVFDDGFQKSVYLRHIIGNGFQSISAFRLKRGQKVFLTLNGREVPGSVLEHDIERDCVIVNVKLSSEELNLERRIDDVRLLESRKSARLVDQDTDYSKLADVSVHTNENKKRPVSHVIDVPSAKAPRYRHSSEERENSPGEDDVTGNDVEMMDETIAAMVLTSLSCSPASPHFPTSFMTDVSQRIPPPLSSSATSSGFHSERSDPSPPSSHLSESAPASSGFFFGNFQKDDGIDVEDEIADHFENEITTPRRKRHMSSSQKRTMFKCTWPGCGKLETTCHVIEKHVRTAHLGCKDSDSDLSDHEEEFYFTEIEVNVENVTQKFSEMCTSSPPDFSGINTDTLPFSVPDHDYQKKDHQRSHASSVPSGGFFQHGLMTTANINIPQIKRSLSWQNNSATSSSLGSSPISPPIRVSKPTPQERLQQHQAQSPKSHLYSVSPKSGQSHRKPRSEVRKCRKVYGMENREMWCTQCKWKKACSRFVD